MEDGERRGGGGTSLDAQEDQFHLVSALAALYCHLHLGVLGARDQRHLRRPPAHSRHQARGQEAREPMAGAGRRRPRARPCQPTTSRTVMPCVDVPSMATRMSPSCTPAAAAAPPASIPCSWRSRQAARAHTQGAAGLPAPRPHQSCHPARLHPNVQRRQYRHGPGRRAGRLRCAAASCPRLAPPSSPATLPARAHPHTSFHTHAHTTSKSGAVGRVCGASFTPWTRSRARTHTREPNLRDETRLGLRAAMELDGHFGSANLFPDCHLYGCTLARPGNSISTAARRIPDSFHRRDRPLQGSQRPQRIIMPPPPFLPTTVRHSFTSGMQHHRS